MITMRPMRITLAIFTAFMLFSCTGKKQKADQNTVRNDDPSVDASLEYIQKHLALKQEAARIVSALDDRQLAAQVIITGIDGRGQLPRHMKTLLEECPAGGIMLFRYNLDTDNSEIKSLISETAKLISAGAAVTEDTEKNLKIKIAPFICIDHEGGKVNRFRSGLADIPSASSYWEMAQEKSREKAIACIYTDSFNAGRIINSLGVNFNFAPVAESLYTENRSFLEDRSYGPDPAFTAKAAAAFIMGMDHSGLLCAVKHFPGSTGADPHLYPSVLYGDKNALAELVNPFADLIKDNHIQALMVSHTSVPSRDSENIASLSPAIMGKWLRQELGYNGIIICDDFSMAAAGSIGSDAAVVKSLAAGADMVLVWQADLRRTHRTVLAALNDGRLPRQRIQEAAGQIIYRKLNMGLLSGE